MYSLVLLAALTTTTDTPNFHHHGSGGCYGCCGCYGGCYGGCWGGCYGGCWGGCYGGCYGGYSYGCCGCWGGHYSYGCGGCWGGCWGGYSYGCCGCYGGGGFYQGQMYLNGNGDGNGKGSPGSGSPKGSPEGSSEKKIGGGEGMQVKASTGTAKLILDVPEDARVYVDNHLMKSTSTHRVYSSPALDAGQAYFYDVRIEVDREGKVVATNKRVIVRAGEEFTESFVDLGKKNSAVTTAKADK